MMTTANETAGCPNFTIAAMGQAIRSGATTTELLVKGMLDRIAAVNPTLNSFITVRSDFAMQQATRLDRELQQQCDRGPLHGIPIAVKDNIDTAGVLTTVGSAYFRDRVPTTDAAIVQCLAAAGAILLGKTNLSEFAANVSGQNATYGHMPNPWQLDHTAGGSSGGMASAIAAHLCLAGIGTDTGGSIRLPASWNGIVGLRPTHGWVSVAGVFPRAPSFDTVGVMAQCVADAEIVWNAIAPCRDAEAKPSGYTPRMQLPPTNVTVPDRPLQGLRLGVMGNYTFRNVDAAVAQAIHHAIQCCQQAGAEILTVACPLITQQFDPRLYTTIGLYEFHQILGAIFLANPHNFSAKVQRDLTLGSQITIAAYTQAQTIRHQHLEQLPSLFHAIDLWLTPTTPSVAPLLTAAITQRDRQFMQPFSWLGLPALALPCGWSGGLPIGLQLIGDRHTETQLLRVAAILEAILLPSQISFPH